MIKKLVSLVFCLALVLGLVACSDDKASSSSEDDFEDYVADLVDDAMSQAVTTFENVGDGTKVTFVENDSGILTPVGDTVRELDIDCCVELVGYNKDDNVFVFDAKNDSKDFMFSIQDVQVFDGSEVVVADDLKLPVSDNEYETEDDINAWSEAVYKLYNVDPGGELTYSASFSRIKTELKTFDVTLSGYYASNVDDTYVYYSLTWKCSLE